MDTYEVVMVQLYSAFGVDQDNSPRDGYKRRLHLWYLHLFTICLHVCMLACMCTNIYKRVFMEIGGQLATFNNVGSGDWTHIVRLGVRCLDPLNHLSGPIYPCCWGSWQWSKRGTFRRPPRFVRCRWKVGEGSLEKSEHPHISMTFGWPFAGNISCTQFLSEGLGWGWTTWWKELLYSLILH